VTQRERETPCSSSVLSLPPLAHRRRGKGRGSTECAEVRNSTFLKLAGGAGEAGRQGGSQVRFMF
jgi:hypothetical protein